MALINLEATWGKLTNWEPLTRRDFNSHPRQETLKSREKASQAFAPEVNPLHSLSNSM